MRKSEGSTISQVAPRSSSSTTHIRYILPKPYTLNPKLQGLDPAHARMQACPNADGQGWSQRWCSVCRTGALLKAHTSIFRHVLTSVYLWGTSGVSDSVCKILSNHSPLRMLLQRPWGGWASDPITSSTPILDRYQFRDRVLHGSSAWLIQVGCSMHAYDPCAW